MSYDDAPRVRFERYGTHIARKEYRCFYCSGPIPKGTRYRKSVYMTTDDDRPFTYREHIDNCTEATE